MTLKKTKLGQYIEQVNSRNKGESFTVDSVRGISTKKFFIPTKADMNGVSLKNYKIVQPGEFAYVSDTSRRGDKISLAFNNSNEPYLVSSISTVFKISSKELDPYYLFIYFNRPEFDRYSRFNSWGSARETFSWVDLCDMDLFLPNITIQLKCSNIYKGMIDNQKEYEYGLEDLKMTCDVYIEKLKREVELKEISPYLEVVTERNNNNEYKLESVVGVSQEKKIIPTKADASNNDLSKFIIIRKNDFVYNPRNGVAVGINLKNKNFIISWNNTAFRIINENLIPEYLFMFLSRSEWDRKVKFDSWGSSTEVYGFKDLAATKIPIPRKEIQQNIVDIFHAYNERREVNEKLKDQIKNICPILIKGSLEEI